MHNERISARLEALEALEAEAEQARDDGPPDIEDLEAPYRFGYLLAALRAGALHTGEGWHAPPIRLTLGSPLAPAWAAFYAPLVEWAQPILDAWGCPFVPLFGDEITQAIAVIDSGRTYTHSTWYQGGTTIPGGFWLAATHSSEDEHDLLWTVNIARRLVHWQLNHPYVVGEHELRTVDEWRAWLVEVMEQLCAT